MENVYTFGPFRGSVVAVVVSGDRWAALTSFGWLARGSGGASEELHIWDGMRPRGMVLAGDRLLLTGDAGTRMYSWPDLELIVERTDLAGGPVAAGGGQLVASSRFGNIVGLDAAGSQRWELSFKRTPYSIAVDASRVCAAYANDGLKVWPIQADGTPKKRALGRVDGIPVSVALLGGDLWVAHAQMGRLDRISPDLAAVLQSVSLGRTQQISAATVGARSFIVGSGQRRAWAVDAATATEVASAPVTGGDAEFPRATPSGDLWFGLDNAVVRVAGFVGG